MFGQFQPADTAAPQCSWLDQHKLIKVIDLVWYILILSACCKYIFNLILAAQGMQGSLKTLSKVFVLNSAFHSVGALSKKCTVYVALDLEFIRE